MGCARWSCLFTLWLALLGLLFLFELNRRTERLEVTDLTKAMFDYWVKKESSKVQNLPDSLKGVFWMSDNPAPEMAVVLEAGSYCNDSLRLSLDIGSPYTWSWSNDLAGWTEYGLVVAFFPKIAFQLSQNLSYADLTIYGLGGLFTFAGNGLSMVRGDPAGSFWNRTSYESDGSFSDYSSYTLKKLMYSNGTALPAQQEMISWAQSNVFIKNSRSKTSTQLVRTDLLGGKNSFNWLQDMMPRRWILIALAVPMGIVAFVLVLWIEVSRRTERIEAGEAARVMSEKWKDHPGSKDLPAPWRGVFWMSDNPAPEALTVLTPGDFDLQRKRLSLMLGQPWAWSHNDTFEGWLFQYFPNCIAYHFFIPAYAIFDMDEKMDFAQMTLWVLGFPVRGMSIRRLDEQGHQWDRETLGVGTTARSEYMSYTLKKIIEVDGTELPAFSEMREQFDKAVVVKEARSKTSIQIVHTDWCGSSTMFASMTSIVHTILFATYVLFYLEFLCFLLPVSVSSWLAPLVSLALASLALIFMPVICWKKRSVISSAQVKVADAGQLGAPKPAILREAEAHSEAVPLLDPEAGTGDKK